MSEQTIPTMKQLLTLIADKIENSQKPTFPRLKKAKESFMNVVSDEKDAITSALSIYQAKRVAAKANRNPEFLMTLFAEMNQDNS